MAGLMAHYEVHVTIFELTYKAKIDAFNRKYFLLVYSACVCVCVCACVRAYFHAFVCVCVHERVCYWHMLVSMCVACVYVIVKSSKL